MNPASLPEGIPEQFLLELFVRSGSDSLQRMREALRRWVEAGDAAPLTDVRRLAHNLKGASWQLGFDELAHLAAAMESRAGDLLGRSGSADPHEVALFDEAFALVTASLEAIAENKTLPELTTVTRRLEAGS